MITRWAMMVMMCSVAGPLMATHPAASERHALEIEGVVRTGPCSESVLLLDDHGRSYELDTKQAGIVVGMRARFDGHVYPRVSRCNHFAWFALQQVHAVTTAARQPAHSAQHVNLRTGTLVLVYPLAHIQQGLIYAKQVKTLVPSTLSVAVGVRAGLKELAIGIRQSLGKDYDWTTGVRVLAVDPQSTTQILHRHDDRERTFPTLDAFLRELDYAPPARR